MNLVNARTQIGALNVGSIPLAALSTLVALCSSISAETVDALGCSALIKALLGLGVNEETSARLHVALLALNNPAPTTMSAPVEVIAEVGAAVTQEISIPVVEAAVETKKVKAPQSVKFESVKEGKYNAVLITAPYNKTFIEAIKSCSFKKYVPETKQWIVNVGAFDYLSKLAVNCFPGVAIEQFSVND